MDTAQGGVLVLNKRLGETPLERICRLKIDYPEFRSRKLTYAGRLDPMAEGILLILYGEERMRKEKYLELDKKYTFEMVFGAETDTGDIMGKITCSGKPPFINEKMMRITLEKFLGKNKQTYPSYSSKPVKGRPLFAWAREGKIQNIVIPEKEIEIYDIKQIENKTVPKVDFERRIVENLKNVRGDFRQDEIVRDWQNFFQTTERREFEVFTVALHCSSGTYVRSIARELGKRLGSCAFALSIKRTAVGGYTYGDTLS